MLNKKKRRKEKGCFFVTFSIQKKMRNKSSCIVSETQRAIIQLKTDTNKKKTNETEHICMHMHAEKKTKKNR